MTIEVMQVADEMLVRAAEERGSRSTEAKILQELRLKRAQDRQMFAFRCGSVWFMGSTPDARTERAMIELAEEFDEEE
jgi:uncharacterized protein with PhoU and TrkA domain